MSSSSWPSHTEPSSAAEPAQVVTSPELVALHFPIAGPSARMLAYSIDLIVIGLLMLGLLVLFLLATPLAKPLSDFLASWIPDDPSARREAVGGLLLILLVMVLFAQLVIEWIYFTLFELTMSGRSPGKWLIGLRVMRDGGLPITLRESLLRNLLRMVDVLPSQYLVGLVTMVMSPEGKRLGDLVAGTVVVRTASAPAPRPLPPRDAAVQSAFRFERAQLARIGPAEGTLIRQALRRSEEFSAEQGSAILARAAEALCARLDYRPLAPGEHRDFLLALLNQIRER